MPQHHGACAPRLTTTAPRKPPRSAPFDCVKTKTMMTIARIISIMPNADQLCSLSSLLLFRQRSTGLFVTYVPAWLRPKSIRRAHRREIITAAPNPVDCLSHHFQAQRRLNRASNHLDWHSNGQTTRWRQTQPPGNDNARSLIFCCS